jgi:hypothetical protein
VALALRRNVLIEIQPVRMTLYRLGDDGTVYNRFRVKLANRTPLPSSVRLSLDGLPGGRVLLDPNPVALAAGQSVEREFEIAARPWPGAQDVNQFRIAAAAAAESRADSFDETFLLPPEDKSK